MMLDNIGFRRDRKEMKSCSLDYEIELVNALILSAGYVCSDSADKGVRDMEAVEIGSKDVSRSRCLIVLVSYHHKNTEKIAKVLAEVLNASIITPQHVRVDELQEYDLIGFGSGIYGGKNHRSLLDLADSMPLSSGKKAFIFSTNGAPVSVYGSARYSGQAEYLKMVDKNHLPLREKLQSKGYEVIDDFSCAGLNTNSFLKLFGGINKGRPNNEDLRDAEEFARELKGRL